MPAVVIFFLISSQAHKETRNDTLQVRHKISKMIMFPHT